MSALYSTTGSTELPPICFVDGEEAKIVYGVETRAGGPCPECKGPVHQTLSFNPTDSSYYFNCPLCNKWIRWCDINGNLSDFKVVTSRKRTKLDVDLEEGHWWPY